MPWDETVKVPIEQAGLVFGGRIDRLDIRASGEAEMHQNITVTVEPSAYLQAVVARAEAASRVQLNGQLGTGMQGPGDNSVKSTQGPPTGSQE